MKPGRQEVHKILKQAIVAERVEIRGKLGTKAHSDNVIASLSVPGLNDRNKLAGFRKDFSIPSKCDQVA